MEEEKEIIIYNGDRGEKFVNMLKKVLKKGNIKDEYISQILDEEGLKLYSQAFTHPTANENENYEPLEILGDSIVNCCIVWYLSRRFPQLNCQDGVKIIARLKINLVSKKTFADFGKQLGLWNFVTADMEIRDNKMKKTLEDVFEALFGATQKLVDQKIRMGIGYSICYNITKNLFDTIPISLKYEDLYDAKTRLKEIFDAFRKDIEIDGKFYKAIGQIKYENERIDRIQYVKVYRTVQHYNSALSNVANQKIGQEKLLKRSIELQQLMDKYSQEDVKLMSDVQFRSEYNKIQKRMANALKMATLGSKSSIILIGEGSAALLPDAQQKAAAQGIRSLAKLGYIKKVPEIYKTLCKN